MSYRRSPGTRLRRTTFTFLLPASDSIVLFTGCGEGVIAGGGGSIVPTMSHVDASAKYSQPCENVGSILSPAYGANVE